MGPMLWRFLVMDDETVDLFLVRDIDDRFTVRDSLCVQSWIRSGKTLHCTRDHQSHLKYRLMGGMFGARRRELKNRCGNETYSTRMRKYNNGYFADMNYLDKHIWPCVAPREVDCCDRHSWGTWPGSHPFPLLPDPGSFVGIALLAKCYIPTD